MSISNTAPVIAEARATPNEFTSEHLAAALQLAAEKLPPKRIAFVDAYVENGFDGAKAYRTAGYKVKNGNVAKVEASKFLTNPNVQSYLMWRLRQITARDDCQIDEGRIIRESSALAFSCITDIISWDNDGKVSVKPSESLPREVAVAIKKIKSSTRSIPQEDGDPIEITTVEVELHDKKGALDLQARIAGMLREARQSDFSNYTLNCYYGEPPAKQEKDISPSAAG